MAHAQQFFFVSNVRQFLPRFFTGVRVAEIGSLNINGTVRDLFTGCAYTGLDVGEGKDVDLVCPGEDFGAPAGSFEVVISCEAMEHNPNWRKTWINMIRIARDDGLVVMTCATPGRRQHGTAEYLPGDSPLTMQKGQSYYRNLAKEDFASLLHLDAWFSVWAFFTDPTAHDLYFFGLGRDASEAEVQSARQLKAAFEDYYFKKNVLGLQ